jgi:hypothetical protein
MAHALCPIPMPSILHPKGSREKMMKVTYICRSPKKKQSLKKKKIIDFCFSPSVVGCFAHDFFIAFLGVS